ncbi:cupin domain-containing protein [Rhodovarius crocodyli]|uniref:Cupin domain-containing protein n=1 Tax=Rhodovarius crocodyli TaxID=1979269 RepID=A0A437M1I5_9PROT|nr:cupin domain-containing protein [Rhodovarius crocodyli]RVT91571.1 cupin domain-containing protein [Rhodovarius crocodyli]
MDAQGLNLFDLPPAGGAERFDTLLTRPGVTIERIVSTGQASPEGFWYDQDRDEFVLLLSGAARLTIEGQAPRDLRPGDWLHLPAHCRHRVEYTQAEPATVWLAVHW